MSDEMKASETEAPATAKPNGRHDVITHRIVVLSLGLTVILTGLNMTILQALGRTTPPELANIGCVAVGALAMCLSSIMRQP